MLKPGKPFAVLKVSDPIFSFCGKLRNMICEGCKLFLNGRARRIQEEDKKAGCSRINR